MFPQVSKRERTSLDVNAAIYFVLSILPISMLISHPPKELWNAFWSMFLMITIPCLALGTLSFLLGRMRIPASRYSLPFGFAIICNLGVVYMAFFIYTSAKGSGAQYPISLALIICAFQVYQVIINYRIIKIVAKAKINEAS